MLYVDSRKSFKIRREKKLIYLPSAKKTLGKIISLPSAKEKHSANLLLRRVPLTDTRQTPNGRHTSWRMSTWQFFAECLCFAECFFLVCRVFFFSTRQRVCLPSAIILPSVFFAALGKELVCRVPDRIHSTNIFALSKSAISSGECSFAMFHVWLPT